MKVKKAVVPAAGMGTRFLPATKAQPKEMLPLIDKPAIQYIVEEAVQSGIEDILIVTGRFKRAIEDHFDRSFELENHLEKGGKERQLEEVRRISELANIHYVRQRELRGLGHAVSMARSFVGNEPFAVLLGDDIVRSDVPALSQLLRWHEQTEKTVIGVQPVPRASISSYGVIAGHSEDGEYYSVSSLVEKPEPSEAPTNLGIVGRYVINPGIFGVLDETPPGKLGEIQLTDALSRQALDEGVGACVIRGDRFDIGDRLGYIRAIIGLALARPDIRPQLLALLVETVESEFAVQALPR